ILYSLFFILYSAGVVFLFLLFLTFLGWVDLGGLWFLCFRFLFKVFCLLILLKFFYCFIQRFLRF
ncbi:hypothetical protein HMPREF1413_00181, partial [Helicobacter pylori GAM252Bi]